MDYDRPILFLMTQRDLVRLELINNIGGMCGENNLRMPLLSDQFTKNLEHILQAFGVNTILRFFDKENTGWVG